MKTSYRHRRMVNDRLNREDHQKFIEEQSWESFNQDELQEPTDFELVSQLVAEEVEVYRAALAMLSSDMLAIYNFIEEWTNRTERAGKYARGQRIVVEHLSKIMAYPLHDGLVGGPFDPKAEMYAEQEREAADWDVTVGDGLDEQPEEFVWQDLASGPDLPNAAAAARRDLELAERDRDLAQFEVPPEDEISYLYEVQP